MRRASLSGDIARVRGLITKHRVRNGRTMVAIAGPPGSGKSTLAEQLVIGLNEAAPPCDPIAGLITMDGFHLDNAILEARGALHRKGAPDTFNAAEFCDTVRDLARGERDRYLPKFDRGLDLAIANAVFVRADTPILIVEGNYLLLDRAPWAAMRDHFAATVFICPPRAVLSRRLQQRWIAHGLDPETARRRAQDNDMVNADLVIRNSHPADLTLDQAPASNGNPPPG